MINLDPFEPSRRMRRFLFCPRLCLVLGVFLCAIFVALLAQQSYARMTYSLDEPIGYRRANSAVDIIYDGHYIWMATPRGVSATEDRGATWITYDATNGLNASDVSAIAYADGVLWVACAHSVATDGGELQWGDGFNSTTDDGYDWDSFQPEQASSAQMLAFDIAILDSAIWAPSFGGGLIRSLDGGQTWHNIFATEEDSIDFVDEKFQSRSNLYYSAIVDTFYQDTAVVWAGSAAGVHKFTYIDETRKLAGMRILDIAYDGDSTVWFAADGGVSRGLSNNFGSTYWFLSWDKDQGLLGDYYTAIKADLGTVIAAAWDPESEEGLGFDITTSDGESWYSSQPDQAVGEGKMVKEIVRVGDSYFAACSEGGLIRTTDLGGSWDPIYPFPEDTSPDKPFNRFYSIYPESLGGDSLAIWAGCDTGVVVFTFDDIASDPVDIRHIPLVETDTTGQSVQAVFVWDLDTTLVWDSDTVTQQVWITTYPVDRQSTGYRVMRSVDRGATWTYPIQIAQAYDIGLWQKTLTIGMTGNMLVDTTGVGRGGFESVRIGHGANAIDSAFSRLEYADFTFWIATVQGALRVWGPGFAIERVTTDPMKFDRHVLYNRSEDNLSGDFITALGLQYHDGVKTIWAATQRTETGVNGVTSTTNDGADWVVRESGVQAINFAFDDSDVYFAAYQGLYRMLDGEDSFSKMTVRESSGKEISENAEFYSCRVIDGDLWVGSSDGLAVLGGDTIIFRDFPESEEPYASPVPVSPTKGLGFVRLHYQVPVPAYVTIKVYDFAMNLVRTVIDNRFRESREENDWVHDDTWDLLNGRGDQIATGVYYFLVETSTGQQTWGKIMVLP